MRYLLLFIICLLWECTDRKFDAHTVNKEVYYTCSMHPQVMVSVPGKCPICQMPLVAVKNSAVPDKDELQLSDQQIQLGNISVDTIRSGDIGSQTVLTAILNYDQTKTSAISSRVMGRIERLYFKNTGDYVRKGDRLYDIYSEELNNAKQEYLQTRERRRVLAGNELINFAALEQSAENKLRLWGMSSSQIRQLAQTGKASPTTTFYSTDNGYITALNILQGDYVLEGGNIIELVDLSTLWAEAQVYPSQYSSLARDARVLVRIPDMGDEAIPGRISFVNPEILSGSRVNLIRVSIPNRNKLLKPGMPAYVYLSSAKRSSFTLPVDAVIRDSKGATVWVQTGKNTFKGKMVETGAEANNKIEIKSGLLPGDLVVVRGAYLINSEFIFKNGASPMEGHNM